MITRNILQAIHARKIMLDENTDKLLRNTSMAKKKEVISGIVLNVFRSCYLKNYQRNSGGTLRQKETKRRQTES